jgi:hypothetical protein
LSDPFAASVSSLLSEKLSANMSNLTKQSIQFKEIYLHLYGIQLTDLEAEEMSRKILSFIKLSLLPNYKK